MRFLRPVAVALAVGAGLLLAGCGESAHTTNPATTPYKPVTPQPAGGAAG